MWTSSLRLRRKTIAASACAVALAYPAAGLAAGGTPMPEPDDPPSTLTPSSTKTTRASRVEDRNGRHQADGGVRGPGADAGRAARRRTGHVGTHPGHPQRPDTRARRRAARRAAHDVDGAVGHQNHAVPDPVDEDDRVRQTDAASETKTDTEGDGEAEDPPSGGSRRGKGTRPGAAAGERPTRRGSGSGCRWPCSGRDRAMRS